MTSVLDPTGRPTAPANDELSIASTARQRNRRRILRVNLARLVLLVFIIGGWQLFTAWKIVDPFFFGQPSGIAKALRDLFVHGTAYGSVWSQIGVTMKEAMLGFVYGVVGGIVFGIALGQSRFLAEVAGPFIKVANAIPRIVLGSIFVVAFGFGTTSKVLLAAVLVFFVVFFNAFQGVREVDRNLINNVRVLGGSRVDVNRHVILPSALTWIIASLHVAFGFSVIGAIVGEFLGAQKGLGLVISTAQNHFDPDTVFATMVIIAAITLAAEYVISLGEHRLLSWRPPSASESTAGI
ncbi:ABC transporter permease [Acidiferrimicrobium sp. IK]|uniref:ABC transporter permease n=1 Tax=Acidiferrimicrobium sp. IK TaxID=2871700 RepID=UPI0021CB6938|nr:ABC transporter permease [Acidiferrimicrobium sp. IK]MCU4186694.1 ABC transporter permease [Acidiferrimicrobium sp. IK]